MREGNLLCLRRRKFVVATTNSNHARPINPNLAQGMALTGINQFWVADITTFGWSWTSFTWAVVLDVFSPRVIGRALDRTREDDLTIAACGWRLKLAHRSRVWCNHSDGGVQYASGDYTGLLKDHLIAISMSRKGNPYEPFMKTLKYDEVHRQEYRDLAEARASSERS